MHISCLKNTDELQSLILQNLKASGVKHRIKKLNLKHSTQVKKNVGEKKLFKRPLHHLRIEYVTLDSGSSVEIPAFVVEACEHIQQNISVEGLFRKAGSNARQKELKVLLDSGKKFGPHHHVIDVANILKNFFRELPDPLLPYSYHELFLRSILLKDKKEESVLLTCLLLPSVHLYTLEYLMQFLQKVASFSDINKMDITNLAIIITPSIMPVEEKMVGLNGMKLGYHVEVVEILLKNAHHIGELPEYLCIQLSKVSQIPTPLDQSEDMSRSRKKKKRRSGSLTRMINGFKKMVGKGSPQCDESNFISHTADFSTPCVKSSKKRKVVEHTSAFSNKKKRDVLDSLPQGMSLSSSHYATSTYTNQELYLTPQVCAHPNPTLKSQSPLGRNKHRRLFTSKFQESCDDRAVKEISNCSVKAKAIGSRSRNDHKKKQDLIDTEYYDCNKHRNSVGSWIQDIRLPELTNSPNGIDLTDEDTMNIDKSFMDLSPGSAEFVHVPKKEYEAIKNRVSAIENRISQEFESIDKETEALGAVSVQTAYERTLEESEKLDGGQANQLAKRLSRELKIRRNSDGCKVIRSPSARKIGILRRKSKEYIHSPVQSGLKRNLSWHSSRSQQPIIYSQRSLRRGKPNTLQSGLPNPTPLRIQAMLINNSPGLSKTLSTISVNSPAQLKVSSINTTPCQLSSNEGSYFGNEWKVLSPHSKKHVRRASSFHGSELPFSSNYPININKSGSQANILFMESQEPQNNETWQDAHKFIESSVDVPVTGRASVAKLRSENAGMVLERTRLFDRRADNICKDVATSIAQEKVVKNNWYSSNLEKIISSGVSHNVNHSGYSTNKEHLVIQNSTAINSNVGLTRERVNVKDSFSPKQKAQGRSPRDVQHRLKNKQMKCVDENSRLPAQHKKSVREKTVKKSNSCRAPKNQPILVRFNKTAPAKSISKGKENVSTCINQCLSNRAIGRNISSKDKSQLKKKVLFSDETKFSNSTVSSECHNSNQTLNKSFRLQPSPLKDLNRINLNLQSSTRNTTPLIKQSLLSKSPRKLIQNRYITTPLKVNTPLKAFTPIRYSPRNVST